jgi:N-acetylmuramoyl-L-alanine amidase
LPKLTRTHGVTVVSVLLLAGLSACGLTSGGSGHDAGAGSVGANLSNPGQGGASRAPAHHAKQRSGNHQQAATQAKPLAGKVVGIDPGHNGRNDTDPSYLNHRVWNGREWEACDTTGTETNAGYREPRFTWRVARYLRADLQAAGAHVVMTRTNNQGVGPCVNRRARILNHAHSNVAIDIHADGGPANGRGFSILEPVKDGPNNEIISSSKTLGRDVHAAMLRHTKMPVSNYYGRNGYQPRDDLAGLNLATQPKVLLESGNMRNRTDARMLTSDTFQRQLARALTDAIENFLAHR